MQQFQPIFNVLCLNTMLLSFLGTFNSANSSKATGKAAFEKESEEQKIKDTLIALAVFKSDKI
jgi:hypothetical protein